MGNCGGKQINSRKSIYLSDDQTRFFQNFNTLFKLNPFYTISKRSQSYHEEQLINTDIGFEYYIMSNFHLNENQIKYILTTFNNSKDNLINKFESEQFIDIIFLNITFFMLSSPGGNNSRKELFSNTMINQSFEQQYKIYDLDRLDDILECLVTTSIEVLIEFILIFMFIEETSLIFKSETNRAMIENENKEVSLIEYFFEKIKYINKDISMENIQKLWLNAIKSSFSNIKLEKNKYLLTLNMREDIIKKLILFFNPLNLVYSIINLRIPASTMRLI